MSRIGKLPINLPSGVNVSLTDGEILVKGKLGEISQSYDAEAISVTVDNNIVRVDRKSDLKDHKAKHGLYRSLIANMVKGVSEGFVVKQELVGVGYKATNTGQNLELTLGYSHNLLIELPKEIKVTTETLKGKNPVITLESVDKQLIGLVAAKIRSFRKPEPYNGKGIKFVGEILRRKAGKSAGKGKK
jgi:large subunit ribosomal protein L6